MSIKRYLHVLLVDQNFQGHFYGMKGFIKPFYVNGINIYACELSIAGLIQPFKMDGYQESK